MTSKGQVTIPKDLRDRLKLSAGTRLYMTEHQGRLLVLPKNKSIGDLAGILSEAPVGAGATLEDYDAAIGTYLGDDDDRIKREWNESFGAKE